jgi:uncharacterized Zn finger protein
MTSDDEPPFNSIEVVHAHGHPFLHCMTCGTTHTLLSDTVTVADVLATASEHECMGPTDAE